MSHCTILSLAHFPLHLLSPSSSSLPLVPLLTNVCTITYRGLIRGKTSPSSLLPPHSPHSPHSYLPSLTSPSPLPPSVPPSPWQVRRYCLSQVDPTGHTLTDYKYKDIEYMAKVCTYIHMPHTCNVHCNRLLLHRRLMKCAELFQMYYVL